MVCPGREEQSERVEAQYDTDQLIVGAVGSSLYQVKGIPQLHGMVLASSSKANSERERDTHSCKAGEGEREGSPSSLWLPGGHQWIPAIVINSLS